MYKLNEMNIYFGANLIKYCGIFVSNNQFYSVIW